MILDEGGRGRRGFVKIEGCSKGLEDVGRV